LENTLSSVEWVEKTEMMDDLLNQVASLTTSSMDQGFEAEVMKISSEIGSFVLKIWNKNSNPDIRFQFHLLKVLFEQGFAVSRPVGWGMNPNTDKVLFTSFDGMPIREVNEKKMTDIAKMLSKIHQIHVEEIRNIQLPKYDFIDYFFPGVEEHTVFYDALVPLVQLVQMKQERLIHGDFHLSNIVEENERITIIDWTNGQLGDPRYDFAWSLTLKKIYLPGCFADAFSTAYLLGNDMGQEELEVFEAIACLRWHVLNRSGGVPTDSNIVERIKCLMSNNPFLKMLDFKDFSIKKDYGEVME
jgi:Ser/Thr protein kinase RdoA (MazF antagonist)